jgi:hypothetical protein
MMVRAAPLGAALVLVGCGALFGPSPKATPVKPVPTSQVIVVDDFDLRAMAVPKDKEVTLRVDGPAFPAVNAGKVSGVIRDRKTIGLLLDRLSGLSRNSRHKPESTPTMSTLTFEWRQGGEVKQEVFTFDPVATTLPQPALDDALEELSRRHRLGFVRSSGG